MTIQNLEYTIATLLKVATDLLAKGALFEEHTKIMMEYTESKR